MSQIQETDVRDWRKIFRTFLLAEEIMKSIELTPGNLPGGEQDRIRTAISTIRCNRKDLEDRFEYEKSEKPAKPLVDTEREKAEEKVRNLLGKDI